jgi:hypothetical protein
MQRVLFFGLSLLPLLTACGEKPGINSTCEDFGTCDFDDDGWALADGDCDDSDGQVFPGAEEIWYDGVDQDCSGTSDFDADEDGLLVDDDCDDADFLTGGELDWYFDGDDDGFGAENSVVWDCEAPGNQWVDNGLDCDDTDSGAFPGAAEIAGDGVDQDCDGTDPIGGGPKDCENGDCGANHEK